jgi:tRNA(fMet)-specific endonuclease VapC
MSAHRRGELVVVDTDVMSYLFKRDTRATEYEVYLHGRVPVLSFMTRAELDAWGRIAGWGARRYEELDTFLQPYAVHYPDREFCRVWAEVYAGARRRGISIQSADAWIAATALFYAVPLLTHNSADFIGVDGLQLVSFGS